MSLQPTPVVGWDDTDDQWRTARRQGCGASDVAAILGFSSYRSPWQVWAEKTHHPMAPVDEESEAARLGHLLEPWLVDQAGTLAYPDGGEACLTPHRLYHHPQHPWRRCSPDACIGAPHSMTRWNDQLVQTKTAGLQTGRAHGWTDTTIPLGYELQARWEMHVVDAQVNHVVALVAGRGLCHYPITRDLDLEIELVRQVDAWWTCHVVGGVEPPLTGRDNAMIAALYPRVERKTVDLDGTDAMTYWQAYRDAHADVVEAEARKAEAGTALKALLGDAHTGLVDGRPIATWGERRGRVDWEKVARGLHQIITDYITSEAAKDNMDWSGLDITVDALAEQHRSPTTRTLTIKE